MNPFIAWVNEKDATGELRQIYDDWFARNPQRTEVAHILKCFSQRPDFLRDVIAFSDRVQFSDGHLDRRTKERIATLVSALNKCRY